MIYSDTDTYSVSMPYIPSTNGTSYKENINAK